MAVVAAVVVVPFGLRRSKKSRLSALVGNAVGNVPSLPWREAMAAALNGFPAPPPAAPLLLVMLLPLLLPFEVPPTPLPPRPR